MTGVSLLTYADRLAGGLPGLGRLLEGELAAFSGVHVLPFFTPFDGDDTGFDPVDHTAVDPRLGSWSDIRRIAETREVTADLIVNHVSNRSAEFEDWLARGAASPHDGMFLTFDRVFPNGANETDITAFYRPRPGLPFTPYRGADGSRRLVWTTFMPSQVDIDVTHPAGLGYLERLADTLAAGGVGTVRLDAVGYAVKTPGTDSFMTPQTLEFVAQAAGLIRSRGMRVLVEVHAHHSQQQAIAPLVDLVYDFAFPPLLLDALGTGRSDKLASWLGIRPSNAVTVLDTHDGIGVIDAGPSGDRGGLLSHDEMAAVFRRAAEATNGHSSVASVIPAWMTLPHQINATFFSVLGEDARRMLLARALQIFLPGEPQFYYVGLLGGEDDRELLARTGQGRDVNRHFYGADEVRRALDTDVTRGQLALAQLRRHPVFGGSFTWDAPDPASLELRWTADGHEAALRVRFDDPDFEVALDGAAVPLVRESDATIQRVADEVVERTRVAYDEVAESYAEMIPDTRYEASVDLAMVRHFVESIAARPAAVLDAGCGTGRMIGHLLGLDRELVIAGSDLSPSMLEVARAAHPDVELVVGDNADLPFDDERFEGVLAWYSTIHTPPHRLGPVFEEFRRVLRPGGMLLLGFQAGTGERRIDKPYGHDVELTAYLHHTPYVRDALVLAGFTVTAALDRGPRSSEKHAQGFVLARRL